MDRVADFRLIGLRTGKAVPGEIIRVRQVLEAEFDDVRRAINSVSEFVAHQPVYDSAREIMRI